MSSVSQTWTYAELDRLPESETGDRYEVIEGELVVTPSPIPLHEDLTMELTFVVGPFVRDGHLGRIYTAPIDVVFDERVVVIPDFVFVQLDRLHIVGPKAIEGPPDLVVEILSPSTSGRDLGVKMELYARFGAREYWILDPGARSLTIHSLEDGRYEVCAERGWNRPVARPRRSGDRCRRVVHGGRHWVSRAARGRAAALPIEHGRRSW